MVIDPSLAQGMYNRLCRNTVAEVGTRQARLNRLPPGRQRRGPWFRNRVERLKVLLGDALLCEQTTGSGKNLCTNLIALMLVDHGRPRLGVFTVCARHMRVQTGTLPVEITTHAMTRIVQACGEAVLPLISQQLGAIVPELLRMIANDKSLSPGWTVRLAADTGLYICSVGKDDDGGIMLTVTTFIADAVLDGPNLREYNWLMSEASSRRYSIDERGANREH